MSKARDLSDFISVATVDATEIADLAITHAKLHNDMNLSSKTVTLPSAITNTITNKLPLAGGTLTGSIIIDSSSSASLTLDRVSNTAGSTIDFKTAGALKWYMGLRGLSNDNFYIRDEVGNTNALTITSGGASTFAGTVTASSGLTVGNSNIGSNTSHLANLTINNNGNIGSAYNTSAIQIVTGGDVNFNQKVIAKSSSSGDYVRMYGGSGTGKWDIYGSSANLRFSDNDSAGFVQFDTKVGIGTAAPTSKLEVNGGADGSVVFSGRSDGGNGNNTRFNLIAYANGGGANYGGGLKIQTRSATNVFADAITVQSNGYVGIGTINPDNILHVETSAGGGPQIELESTSGTANSGFIGFDGTSLQISTQRDMVNGSRKDTSKSWGGINIVGAAAGSYIQLATSEGNNNNAVTRMTVSKEGYVAKPYQPAFSVRVPYISAANYTGGSTTICLNPSVIYANIGNHFSGSTGRFTAPVAGYYVFGACVRYDAFTGSYFYMTLTKNASTFLARHLSTATGSYLPMTITAATTLAAGDYVHIVVQSSGDGDVAIDGDSNFFGYLVG